MDFLKIKKLSEYQHYSDREMIWFKWHVSCLQDYDFSTLTPAQKWLFLGLICLACKSSNKIPKDYPWLATQLNYHLPTIENDIKELENRKMLSTCYQDAMPIEREIEEKREEEKKIGKFQKPTITEIQDYAKTINFPSLDAKHFFDFYEKGGWVYGKHRTPVRDWRACVRTWQRNEKGYGKQDRDLRGN